MAILENNDSRIYDYNVLKKSIIIPDVSGITEYEIPVDRMARVTDQGDVDCCVAVVISEILTAISAAQGSKEDYSVSYVYGKHRNADSTGTGMLIETALKSLLNYGSIPYEMFPQLMEMPAVKSAIADRPEFDDYAKSSAIGGYCKIGWANAAAKAENLKTALINFDLPILAVSKTAFPESHCIMIYGFETKPNDIYVKFQNSWGKNWAKNGRGTIPLTDISSMYLLLPKSVDLPFTDVPETAWYYTAVKNAYMAGYVNGKSDTSFAPDDSITRAEMCAIIDRVLRRQNEIHTAEVITLEERLTALEAKMRNVRG